jgi:UDP-glucose 4-epimerase
MNSKLFEIDTICFRPFNIYGPRQPKLGEYAPVMAKFEKQKENGSPLTIFGDGEQTRDFIHVDDVCNALIAGAMEMEPQRGEIYNLGTGKSYSINEIAKMIGGTTEYLPAVDGEVRNTLANIGKAKANLGWVPKKSLEDYYIK